jgi:hypothetical protein
MAGFATMVTAALGDFFIQYTLQDVCWRMLASTKPSSYRDYGPSLTVFLFIVLETDQ